MQYIHYTPGVLKGQAILMTMTTVLALKIVIESKGVAQGYVILV